MHLSHSCYRSNQLQYKNTVSGLNCIQMALKKVAIRCITQTSIPFTYFERGGFYLKCVLSVLSF